MKKWLLLLLSVCLFGVWGCSDDKANKEQAESKEACDYLPCDSDIVFVAKAQNRDATLAFIDAWQGTLAPYFPGMLSVFNIDTIERFAAPFGISLDPLDLSIVAGFVFDERLEPAQFGVHASGTSINADAFIKTVIQTTKENGAFKSGSPDEWVISEGERTRKIDANTVVGQSYPAPVTGLDKTPLIEKALTAKGNAFYLAAVIKMEPLRPVIEAMSGQAGLPEFTLPETLLVTLTNQGVAVQLACDVVFPSEADAQTAKAFVDQVKDPMIQKFENEGCEALSHWLNTIIVYQQGETLTFECIITPEQFIQLYGEFERMNSAY